MAASEKQVKYALSFLRGAGFSTDHMNSKFIELGASEEDCKGPVRDWLANMERSEITELIDLLKSYVY
ncbi:hypothetical protein JD969_02055 [Planctomycetota bacterium]|nr:hypothetical protein JD969_02055 [Planctomycetota bacterium]